MTTSYTPGPWKVETWKYNNNTREVLTIQTQCDAIAQTCGIWRDGDDSSAEEAANARLIAAAPDLLAALDALTEWGCTHTGPRDDNSPHELLIAARAAIAKATRSASCTCEADCSGPVPNYCAEHDGDYSAFLAASNCD
jgi:hypothetical protein